MCRSTGRAALLAVAAALLGGADAYRPLAAPPGGLTAQQAWPPPDGLPALPARVGLGTPASRGAIAGWDIDVRGDGAGLPPGRGTVAEGEALYVAHCAACHGDFGEGLERYPALMGGRGSLATDQPRRTVGSYWPHAPAVFDYIRRAMPYTAPQSLSDDAYYAVTAYVLHLNELLPAEADLDAAALRRVEMPNRGGFYLDDRPDVHGTLCMTGCRDGRAATVTTDSRRFVPPGSGSGVAGAR